MRIAFIIVGNTERGGIINGEKIRYGGVGSSGTDSSVILIAEYLAKVGNEVVVSVEGQTNFEVCRGVKYTNLNFDDVENLTFDVMVSSLWFDGYKSLRINVTKSVVYWCHLAWMYGLREIADYAVEKKLRLGIVHVSNWEKSHNDGNSEYFDSKVGNVVTTIIPNSITTDVMEEVIKENIQRKKRKVIFHAQWSRGGPTALEIVKRLGWDESNFISFDYLKTVAGRADKKTLLRELAESEYFIFPSFTHGRLVYKDTFSCAVAEALAMGVIVVAYPLGALPEYYKDNCAWSDFPDGVDLNRLSIEKVSEMPEMGNTDKMTEVVRLLDADDEKKKLLSERGREVMGRFGTDKTGPMWEKFLNEVTSDKIILTTMNMNAYKFKPFVADSPLSMLEKIVYINLDTRTDRKEQVELEFKKYGISAERFSAVSMTMEESVQMTKDGGANWDAVAMNTDPEILAKRIRGQRSCTKSHLEIIKKAKENGTRNILIFEDDVIFNDEVDVNSELKMCLDELQTKQWDLFVLGCNPRTPFRKDGEHLCRLGGFYNAHAVVVNSTAYDKILNFSFKVNIVIDQFYFGMSSTGMFKVFTPTVPLAFQRESFSDIEGRSYETKYIQKDAYKHFLTK